MRCGCDNCRYCKCHKGDYWTPDDYECTSNVWDRVDVDGEAIRRAWENGETWESNEEPICVGWEEVEPEPDYEDYLYEQSVERQRLIEEGEREQARRAFYED